MTASQGKRKGRALPGRGTRGFRGIGRHGNAGWKHGAQRGLCKQGTDMSTSNQNLQWKVCTETALTYHSPRLSCTSSLALME